MRRIARTFTALLAAIALVAVAAPTLSISVTPRFTTAPGYVRVTVRLEPSDLNRRLCVFYDGTGDASASCRQVDGSSPRTTLWEFKSLSAGVYEFATEVWRSDGTSEVARGGEVTVLEGLPGR